MTTSTRTKPAGPRREQTLSLYRPLDFAMVRAPLLPVEAYLSLKSAEDQWALLKDPRVRRAVAVGSLSLLGALERFERGELSKKDADKLRAKLLRYQIRMSTRPTPYGLFAGCAIVRLAGRTELSLRCTFGSAHTRPDMAWLMDLVATAESDAAIRRQLRLVRNPVIRADGDRISLTARMAGGAKASSEQPISVRATSVVSLALRLARQPVNYSELAGQLMQSSPSATPEKVDRLLTELWEQTFLLSDLRPPLTIESPARYVLDRLAGIAEAASFAARLEAFLAAATAWDRLPHEESIDGFDALVKAADVPEDASKDAPFQTDMALSIEGGITASVAEEAARAAELLLRLSPSPRGLSSIAAYRQAFVSRYGHEREVPLLELLDPDRGLGPVSAHGHAMVGPDPRVSAVRSRTLLALATSALHSHRRIVTLDDETMKKLETWPARVETAPISLDINVLVAAKSAEAIDRGEFQVIVGPNLGGWAAGRNFGRFAHLFPAALGRNMLARAAEVEQASHRRDHLWVEVVFLPSNTRMANVTIRPAVRSHEIVFGISPGVVDVIPVEELVVGVSHDRFFVRWPAGGARLLNFVSGHMLSLYGAPPVAQFLMQVSHDGLVPFTLFDWGPAEGFPFLPRVQTGRIVLRPAEWNISKDVVDPAAPTSIAAWRAAWDVPRHIAISFGDNRLVLDFDLPDHVQQLAAEVSALADGRSLVVQEVLPALDDVWLTGRDGHYCSELIVPLVLRPRETEGQAAHTEVPTEHDVEPAPVLARRAPVHRQHPPGSEWLFVKLYCPAERDPDVVGDALPAFANNVTAAGLADCWFFIRYADPESHIRLRFHGDAERLTEHLFGQICRWANDLVANGLCTRLVFDTYDQEIERFGGVEGMRLSEQLFLADSRAATAIVGALRSKAWTADDDRTTLWALTIDDLLASIGLDDAARLEWYRKQVRDNDPDSGDAYRKLKISLRAAVGHPSAWLAAKPHGDAIASALAERRRALTKVSEQLHDLAQRRQLDQPLDALCTSYVHLHLNRVGAAASERALVGLLMRTRESLVKAPVP